MRGGLAGLRNRRQPIEKKFLVRNRKSPQNLSLQFHGNNRARLVFAAARRPQPKAEYPLVTALPLPLHQPAPLHPLHQGRNGVGIAGHPAGQILLGNPRVLLKRAQHGELVGRQIQRRQAPPEGLVQAVPGVAEQNRQPAGRRGAADAG